MTTTTNGNPNGAFYFAVGQRFETRCSELRVVRRTACFVTFETALGKEKRAKVSTERECPNAGDRAGTRTASTERAMPFGNYSASVVVNAYEADEPELVPYDRG